MLYIVYYIIRPLESLRELLLKYKDIASPFIKGHVWKREEGGYHPGEPEDYMTQVKLIFLANLRFTLAGYAEPEFKELSKAILGEPLYEVGIFDKWWSMERIELDNDFVSILTELSADDLAFLAPTGVKHIDGWLERVIELKQSDKA
jgi:DNA-binding SARP family transcriptional activator